MIKKTCRCIVFFVSSFVVIFCTSSVHLLACLLRRCLNFIPFGLDSPPSLDRLARRLQIIAGQLRGLIYRSMCPKLIKANYILCQFLDSASGWDAKRMREEHHEWIDKLADNCGEVS